MVLVACGSELVQGLVDEGRLERLDGALHRVGVSGNGFPASAGSTWAVTQTGVTAYRRE